MTNFHWNPVQEKELRRMDKFYPPFILSLIRQSVSVDGTILINNQVAKYLNNDSNKAYIDIYSIGILLLYAIKGEMTW
jgi:hypothetical protein